MVVQEKGGYFGPHVIACLQLREKLSFELLDMLTQTGYPAFLCSKDV